MKRTTVFLDETLIGRLRRYAEKEGVSSAAVVREALAAYLTAREEGRGGVPNLAGQFESGRSDTSERADELLWPDPHG